MTVIGFLSLFFFAFYHVVQSDKASAGDSYAALRNDLANGGCSPLKTSHHVQTNWFLRLTIGALITLVYIFQAIIRSRVFQHPGSWSLDYVDVPSQCLWPPKSYRSFQHTQRHLRCVRRVFAELCGNWVVLTPASHWTQKHYESVIASIRLPCLPVWQFTTGTKPSVPCIYRFGVSSVLYICVN